MWDGEYGIGAGALLIVVGFPLVLLAFVVLLGRLEAWMLEPDERAAAVTRVLDEVEHADEVERAVSRMLSDVAKRPAKRRRAPRLLAMRMPARRRAGRARAAQRH